MMWSGSGRVSSRTAEPPQLKGKVLSTLVRLYRYARPYYSRWALAAVTILGVSLLQLVPPWITKYVIDEAIPHADRAILLSAAGALVALHVARGVMAFLNRYIITWVGQHVLYLLGSDLFQHVQRLGLRFYEKREAGDIMSRLTNDINVLQQTLYGNTISSIVGVLNLSVYFVILLSLNWRLTLLIVCTAPAMVVASAITAQILRPRYRRVQEKVAAVNTVLQENISGVRVSKAFAREDASTRKFEERNRENMRAALQTRAIQSISGPTIQLIQTFSTCMILWYGVSLIRLGQLSIGELVAFLSYATAFYQPVNDLIQVNNIIQQALAASDRIFQFLDERPDVVDRPGAVDLPPVEGHVRFEGVTFAYQAGQPVLHGIDLEAQPGQLVALVGHTGSGKTTIINLIPRFYDADSGRVLIDGHDLRDVTQASLRANVAIVLQETHLFDASVRTNIQYGKLAATDEEIERAARLANAHDFIRQLPEGYDTEVSGSGSRLSRGQRQRLSLARAILKNPRILILDEATSDVDTETELLIQEALERVMRGRTSFVIAHRLSTIRNAGKIVVLDHGRIVEQGTHDELLEKGGVYRELYEIQFATPEQLALVTAKEESLRNGRAEERLVRPVAV
ncbi:MAG: ABC transporter ATP-binding protein [Chloroflexi bacterium]|nr:ABC transporter ATP-binding protein [Chloroflexota bacterium]